MTLIKCPQCGHTVLSVASQCPACHGTLGPTYLGREYAGDLAQCRSCGCRVRSGTPACPHCGVRDPAGRGRLARQLLWGAAVVLTLAGAALALRPLLRPEAPPAAVDLVTPPAPAAPSPAWQTEAVPAPSGQAATATRDTAAALAVRTRWTSTWANVRQGPDTSAPVVRVLPPGTEVIGTRGQWGWWTIRWGGDSVGYIAGALLVPTQPPNVPPPEIR